ncbi:TetR/AcrR family transcriptional regulator [Actinomadura meridiana]
MSEGDPSVARPRDPRRRVEILDAVLDHLAEHGMSGLSMRPIAQALGQSTRVLTHHFADKDDLLAALLRRLDDVQHEQLRATEGWDDTVRGIGVIVRDSWRRHLAPENIAHTRLVREIEGLAAAGRLGDRAPTFLADRAEFVARALVVRGLDPDQARVKATYLNGAYAGLQTDVLTTGDRERVEAALDELCAVADSWTENAPRTA